MSIIVKLIKQSKFLFSIIIVLSVFNALANLSIVALINNIINKGIENITSTDGLSFLLATLVVLLSGTLSQVLLAKLSEGSIYNLRMLLIRRILATSFQDNERIGAPIYSYVNLCVYRHRFVLRADGVG